MTPHKFLFLATALISAAGCSAGPTENALIKLEIGRLGRPARLQPVDLLMMTPPVDVGGFDCLAVNVVGAGIVSTYESGAPASRITDMLANDFSCSYPGVTSELIPAETGQTVTISVPKGTDRVIQVLGLQTEGACGAQTLGARISAAADVNEEFTTMIEVGKLVTDIVAPATFQIDNVYEPDGARDAGCTMNLAGTWAQSCVVETVADGGVSSQSNDEVFEIDAANTITTTSSYYTDTGCASLAYTFTETISTVSLGSVVATSNGFARKWDILFTQVIITPATSGVASTFNATGGGFCGFTNWSSGVPKTVPPSCLNNPDTPSFGLISIQGGELILGQPAETEANRPTELDLNQVYFRQ